MKRLADPALLESTRNPWGSAWHELLRWVPEKQTEQVMTTISLNDQNFDTTLAANSGPVLVDFWAEWCGPCKMIAPALEELAKEEGARATVAKVNVDESPELAVRFGITGIPTLIIFSGGQPVKTLHGVQPKVALAAALAAARNR
jgi:thioredoxin 1